MEQFSTYKVKVKTTNGSNDTCSTGRPMGQNPYMSCIDGILYITTNDPSLIYDEVGVKNVISVENIGIGYHIDEAAEDE